MALRTRWGMIALAAAVRVALASTGHAQAAPAGDSAPALETAIATPLVSAAGLSAGFGARAISAPGLAGGKPGGESPGEPVWEPAGARLALEVGAPLDRSAGLASRSIFGSGKGTGHSHLPGLSADRARILLRSLTLPGWGQATAGRTTAAAVFGVAELSVWTTFTAFRIQEQLRRDAYVRTARLRAGIDLRGRDEEYRRIIGSFLSSDEYNQLVVYRDAANLFYDNPSAYWAYINAHVIPAADAWAWDSEASLLRYRGQRKDSQRAGLRSNTALALAVINRLVSTVHAARVAGSGKPDRHSWNLEATPADPRDPTAFRFAFSTRF